MYEIRMCRHDELVLLRDFLKNSWSSSHIFLNDLDLLNFQHKSPKFYNFVVAYHIPTQKFHGVLGVISPNFYVNGYLGQDENIWLAIWCVDKALSEHAHLGVKLLEFLDKEFRPRSISAIGINDSVALLYKLLGFKNAFMNHWFLPNPNITTAELIVGTILYKEKAIPSDWSVRQLSLSERPLMQRFFSGEQIKCRFEYLENRYFKHPSYKYSIYGFFDKSSKLRSIAVGRVVSVNSCVALRINDFYLQDGFAEDIKSCFLKIMVIEAYQYIDFLEYGFDADFLRKLGFLLCDQEVYVPHLFEPFIRERKRVKIAFKSESGFECTKGDSDLDRPNVRA